MTKVRQAFGAWGEGIAVDHLKAAGLRVIERNWRCADGELDIIAAEGETIVFCEVKTRRSVTFGAPVAAVVRGKARRIRVLACRWLAERWTGEPDPAVRFDVVSILTRRDDQPLVEHLRGVL